MSNREEGNKKNPASIPGQFSFLESQKVKVLAPPMYTVAIRLYGETSIWEYISLDVLRREFRMKIVQ